MEIRCRQKVEKVLRHCDRGHLQTVLVAATITTSVKEFCDDHVDWLGSVVNVCCGDLHHMPESVSQQFVRVKKTDKFPQLLAVLQSSGFPPAKGRGGEQAPAPAGVPSRDMIHQGA